MSATVDDARDTHAVGVPGPDGDVERELAGFETAVRTYRFTCSTGERFGGAWRGVPVAAVLEAVPLPPETTHLLVEADDGFRACVPVRDALDGLLALSTADGPIAGAPRFVASGLDGTRTIKRVSRLDPVALASEESPDEYERGDTGDA